MVATAHINVEEVATMSEDANCALVRRFIDEVFNAGNFDGVEEILAADYVHHDPTTQEFGSGIEGFKRLIGYYREAFPDLKITFDDQFGAGDRVVDRWTGNGTHQGELMGIPATGKPISAMGMSIHRIVDGRIAETWNIYDAAGMLRQLGVISGIAR
jgi:steroid delta-isomerase-like uncharacterized protein